MLTACAIDVEGMGDADLHVNAAVYQPRASPARERNDCAIDDIGIRKYTTKTSMAVAFASLCDVSPPPLSVARVVRWTALASSPGGHVSSWLFNSGTVTIMNSHAAGYRLYIEQGMSGIAPPARAKAGLGWSPTHELANP